MLTFSDSQLTQSRMRLVAASGLLLLLSAHAFTQSGRRAPKPGATPVPAQTDQPPTATLVDGRKLTNHVTLIVARQPTSKHLLSEDSITASFIARLNELSNVTATSAGDLNRDKAVKRAKDETDKAVVLLQFDVDSFQNGTIILNSPDLDVRVLILEPQTGQEKFKGKVYYKAVGGPMLKKDNWPNGTPIRITTEAVGIEAAEQVYDWLVVQEINKSN